MHRGRRGDTHFQVIGDRKDSNLRRRGGAGQIELKRTGQSEPAIDFMPCVIFARTYILTLMN